MSTLPAILRGAVVALAVTAAMPTWGQENDSSDRLAAEKRALEKATLEQAAINKAAAELRKEKDKSGSAILDVGVDPTVAKESQRERLTDRQQPYYTYPPAARYLRTRPYFYRSAVPNNFYGGAWPRGYRLGPIEINPNFGNHF